MKKIEKLCEIYNLGNLKREPEMVTGGLMHKMYHVTTDQGEYAIKWLNPNIMKRTEALQNMINSEIVSNALINVISLVAAKRFEGKNIIEFEGSFYVIFDWLEGKSIFVPNISEYHCEQVGRILGKIHAANIKVDSMEKSHGSRDVYDWNMLLEKAKLYNTECYLVLKESFVDVIRWDNHVVNGANPVYGFEYENRYFAVYMSYVGAPGCVADMEDTLSLINTDKYVVFGGAGCLNKEIARGKVMVPTAAYRDEGTSYHYAPSSDYIEVKNADIVALFMETVGLPFVKGKTWTTDAVHRETKGNFEKRKSEGCISVEMECAAVQAMCDFRNLNVYFFFTCGDLLDAPEWDERMKKNQIKNTQHDSGHFDIALELARYIAE